VSNYFMRRIRFRVVLPIVFGFLAAMFFAWDYENNRVVEQMGMGWDTGPPIWPYQAVYLILFAVNAPAYVLTTPLLRLLSLHELSFQYAIWLPAIIGLWWWCGTRVDFGFLRTRKRGHPKLLAMTFFFMATALLSSSTYYVIGDIRWWIRYGHYHRPLYAFILLRTIGPLLWCSVFAFALIKSGIALLQHKIAAFGSKGVGYKEALITLALFAAYVAGIKQIDRSMLPVYNYDKCEFDRLERLGCVHGTVIDAEGKPVNALYVDLVPANASSDIKRWSTASEQTDAQGRFNLNRKSPGKYFVAVHSFTGYFAPTSELPYTTVYFPNGMDEAGAGKVEIVEAKETNLSPMKVRRIPVVTLNVRVTWEDGTRPETSGIWFANTLYPNSGGIEPEIKWGIGQYSLPEGFEYNAQASLDCAKESVSERRRLSPIQRIKIEPGNVPKEVVFIIKGPVCSPVE
jgi:hypothetical protein